MSNDKPKYDINNSKRVTVTLKHNKGYTTVCNNLGMKLDFPELDDSTIILAMLHQTLIARLRLWETLSDNFEIELTIKEVIK